MSDPQLFQPERWEFFRLLERDISGRWLICFDCFQFHPVHWFVEPKTTPVSWLKSCGGLLHPQGPPRSCRYHSRTARNQEAGSSSLCGLVSLCPCIYIWQAKMDRLLAVRHRLVENGPHGQNRVWGLQCTSVYNDIKLFISVTPFVYENDGALGFRIFYIRTSPADNPRILPRMLCPHISLDTLINTFSQCRNLHSDQVVCARCKGLQCCPECHMTVVFCAKDTESTSGTVTDYVEVGRRLDKKLWNKHIVFPFARQRQYESIQAWASWKLW